MLDDPFDPTPTTPLTVENREARLMQFVMWALKHSWKGGSLDGGEMQDKAHLLGILTCVKFDPLLHTDPEGNAGPGDDWYVYSVPLDKFTKINWQVPPAVSAKTTLHPVEKPLFGLMKYQQSVAELVGEKPRKPNTRLFK